MNSFMFLSNFEKQYVNIIIKFSIFMIVFWKYKVSFFKKKIMKTQGTKKVFLKIYSGFFLKKKKNLATILYCDRY